MISNAELTDIFSCAFCGKSQAEVAVLVAGPGVCLCDECIMVCKELVDAAVGERTEAHLSAPPPGQSNLPDDRTV